MAKIVGTKIWDHIFVFDLFFNGFAQYEDLDSWWPPIEKHQKKSTPPSVFRFWSGRAFWRKLGDKGLRRGIWVERSNLGTIKRAGWRWSRSNCIRCPFVQLDQSVHPPFKLADRQSWSWCSWTGCPPSRGERSQEARTQRGGGQQCWQASSDNPKLGPARPIFAPFSPPGRSKLGPFTCQVRTKGIRRGEDKRLTDSDKGIRGRKSFDSECTLQVNENIQAWRNTYESHQIQFLNCFPSLEKKLVDRKERMKKGKVCSYCGWPEGILTLVDLCNVVKVTLAPCREPCCRWSRV